MSIYGSGSATTGAWLSVNNAVIVPLVKCTTVGSLEKVENLKIMELEVGH